MSEKIKKGEYQGECDRPACSNIKAEYFDYSTRKYYCESCAKIINMENELYAHSMYGHDLCIKEEMNENKLKFKEATPESYDGKNIDRFEGDEIISYVPISPFEPVISRIVSPIKEPKHYIGVTRGENSNAYCLSRVRNKKHEPLMLKEIKDRKMFDWEVDCLIKIFNATVIEEV